MLISLPPPPPGNLNQYFARLTQALVRAMAPAVSQNEATKQIILQSSDGTNYSVTVSDAGALVVTLNDGKTRP